MNVSILPLLIGASFQNGQWNRAYHYGKTAEQIVAMGNKKWSEFTAAKNGYSTHAMVDSERHYRDALYYVNEKLTRTRPEKQRSALRNLRKEVSLYTDRTLKIGYSLSGGGTIYQIFWAASEVRIEEAISATLAGRKDETAPVNLSKQMDNLDQALRSVKGTDSQPQDFDEITKAYVNLRAQHPKLINLIKSDFPGYENLWSKVLYDRLGDASASEPE